MEYEKFIRESLKPSRYIHSIGVKDTAVRLARRFGADEKKAEIAAILHDCAKEIDKEDGYRLCKEWGIELDCVSMNNYDIVHQYLGAEIAKRKFEISDMDIISAISCHTTGKADMSVLDKIIYISDMIEPNRKYFDGLEELRKLVEIDLDTAVLSAIEHSISYVIEKKKAVHLDTIRARNSLIFSMK